MELNRNSTVAKIYRWFYMTNEMPKSLCPYAWQLLFMWVLIIPYSILAIPSELLCYPGSTSSIKERLLLGLLVLVLLDALICIPIGAYALYLEFTDKGFLLLLTHQSDFLAASMMIGVTIISCLLIWLFAVVLGKGILALSDKWYSIKYGIKNNSFKQDSVVIEFIKAKYNRYCPKINWK